MSSTTKADKKAIAEKLGWDSVNYLYQLKLGNRNMTLYMAKALEWASDGIMSRHDLMAENINSEFQRKPKHPRKKSKSL